MVMGMRVSRGVLFRDVFGMKAVAKGGDLL